MKKRYQFLLLAGLVGLMLFYYNYWSYSCGRCNVDSLMTISFPARILIVVNIVALLSLILIKFRQQRSIEKHKCNCGTQLLLDWHYCPACGQISKRLETK